MSNSNLTKRPPLPETFVAIEVSISRSAEFMEAFVAACALVSHADGEVAPAERRRVLMIARSEPRLACFSHEELSEEFALQQASYRFDPEIANELALEKIEAIRGRAREAHAVVDACRRVIPADGVAHPAEFRALEKVKRALGIEPDGGASVWVGAPPAPPKEMKPRAVQG